MLINDQGALKYVDFRMDTFELVHRDSSLRGGFAWEFEESGYTDGWVNHGSFTTVSTVNGLLTVTSGSADAYGKAKVLVHHQLNCDRLIPSQVSSV